MKMYIAPRIERGEEVIYSLSIAVEVWVKYLIPSILEEDKARIFEGAKVIHEYFLHRKLTRWA